MTDPMTAANVLATVVQLLGVFKQERGGKVGSDRQQFLEWLVNHRFESLKDFIANSAAAQSEVDTLLRQHLAAILGKLSEIKEVVSPPRTSVEIIAKPTMHKTLGYDSIRLQVWFHNPGPGTINEASIVYTIPGGIMIPEPSPPWRPTTSGYEGTAVASDRPIHPNEMVPIINAELGFVSGSTRSLAQDVFAFRFHIFCQNQPRVSFLLSVGATEIDARQNIKATAIS